jgi:uncharacterized membrane protein YccC
MENKNKEYSRDKIIGGIILLGIGLLFLLSNLDIIPDIGTTWPLILIVIGFALLLTSGKKSKEQESKEAPPKKT